MMRTRQLQFSAQGNPRVYEDRCGSRLETQPLPSQRGCGIVSLLTDVLCLSFCVRIMKTEMNI